MEEAIKRNKKILSITVIVSSIILLLLVVLLATGVIGGDNRTPEEKLIDAVILTSMAEMKEVKTVVEISNLELDGLSGMEGMFVKNIIKDLSVETVVSENGVTEQGHVDIQLLMNGLILMDAEAYIDGEMVVLSVPTLYSKPVMVTFDELPSMMDHMSGYLPEDMELPEMKGITEEEKDTHKVAFELLKEQLVDRDYEGIEQFDAPVYYTLLSELITTLLIEEVMLVEEEVDDETVEYTAYKMAYNEEAIKTFVENVKEAMESDELLEALKESHSDIHDFEGHDMDVEKMMPMMDNLPAITLDEFGLSTEIYLLDDTYVDHSYSEIDITLGGLDALLGGPASLGLEITTEIVVYEESFDVPTIDTNNADNLSSMSKEELEQFGEGLEEEVMASINELLSTFGMDLDSLGSFFGQ